MCGRRRRRPRSRRRPAPRVRGTVGSGGRDGRRVVGRERVNPARRCGIEGTYQMVVRNRPRRSGVDDARTIPWDR